MSHSIMAWVKSGDDHKARTIVYEWNPTYNYQPCLEACGLKSFTNLDGLTAPEAVAVLTTVRGELRRHPEKGNLIRGGGTWGNTHFLHQLLDSMINVLTEHNYTNVQVT